MGDLSKSLNIGVEISYRNNAKGAVYDLREIKDTAQESQRAINTAEKALTGAGSGELAALADKSKAAAQESRGLKDEASGTGLALGGLSLTAQQLRQILDALRQAAAGNLDSAALSAGKAASGFSSLAGPIAMCVAAFGAAFKGGMEIGDVLGDVFTDVQALNDLAADVNNRLKAMGQVEIDLANVDKAVAGITAGYDRIIAKAKEAAAARKEVRDAALSREEAALDLQETKAKAAARTPEEEAAVAAEFARKRYDLRTAQAIWESGNKIRELQNEQFDRQRKLNDVEAQLLKLKQDAATATARYNAEVEGLKAAGVSRSDIASQTSASRADAERARNEVSDQSAKMAPELEALRSAVASLEDQIQAEAIRREAATLQAQKAAYELGPTSQDALRGLEAALREAQQRVSATAGHGSNTDLVAAQGDVQRLQAQLQQAREVLKTGSDAFGQAMEEGAAAAKAKADVVVPQIHKAAENMTSQVGQVSKDIATAAGSVTKAAQDANGQIAGSVTGMRDALVGQIQTLGGNLASSLQNINATIAAQNARLAQVESTAQLASSAAQQALSRSRNG